MKLIITTPFMHNENVKKVQTHLKQEGFLQGPVDGVFGPDTSRAVYRAKYWMGYSVPDHMAGDLFYAFLSGKTQLTPPMKATADSRRRATIAKPLRLKMIEEARKWVGAKESPAGSNKVKFSQWYGIEGPWCAMFVSYCGVHCASSVFSRGNRWAYVPFMVNDAKAGIHGLTITYEPKEGDLVAFDWQRDGLADHIGFFDHWTDKNKNTFRTVEGNTSVGNDSNGGEVMVRDRKRTDVRAFIHVGRLLPTAV